MCEPVTIMALSTALSAAPAAYASYQQAQTAKEQANYQSAVATNNATVAGWQATDATDRGAIAESQARTQTRLMASDQATRLAANGLSLDSGAPASILEDTSYFGEQGALNVRNNAARQAWGFKMSAQNDAGTAGLFKAQANAQDPLGSVGLSLLGSAAKAGGQFASYSMKG